MKDDPAFTLYWRTGDREVVHGRNTAEAMTFAGYGGGALRALDFYASGDDHSWKWSAATREWTAIAKDMAAEDSGPSTERPEGTPPPSNAGEGK